MNILTTPPELVDFAAALAAGEGPVALDAERASGYRYSQRAYLVQVHRRGAGTALIDPIALPSLTPLADAIGETEWILHAATQDLACLAEVGLRPYRLFDTELAGRLLGRERVSLAALVEAELGITLAKGHGAADWSQRPLTAAQCHYAALDVLHLPDLRDRLAEALREAGKMTIADEEFAALLAFQPREPGPEPWRRLSGIHTLRRPEERGIARALWLERDRQARAQDLAPGRVLRDQRIIAFAKDPQSAPEAWQPVIAGATPVTDPVPGHQDPVPPTKSWARKRPEAANRWHVARPALIEAATALQLPVENLMSPGLVRALLWDPPAGPSAMAAQLQAAGARAWQIEAVLPILLRACETSEVTDE